AAPDPGPIVPVGSSSNSASGARSLTLGRPAKTVAGQVMVASIVTSDDAPAVAGPDGWAIVRNDVFPGALRQTIYTRVAEFDEPPAYTWTLSGRAQAAGGLTAYGGVDPTHPVDADAAKTTAAGATATAPSITTFAAGTRLIQFVAVNA